MESNSPKSEEQVLEEPLGAASKCPVLVFLIWGPLQLHHLLLQLHYLQSSPLPQLHSYPYKKCQMEGAPLGYMFPSHYRTVDK